MLRGLRVLASAYVDSIFGSPAPSPPSAFCFLRLEVIYRSCVVGLVVPVVVAVLVVVSSSNHHEFPILCVQKRLGELLADTVLANVAF